MKHPDQTSEIIVRDLLDFPLPGLCKCLKRQSPHYSDRAAPSWGWWWWSCCPSTLITITYNPGPKLRQFVVPSAACMSQCNVRQWLRALTFVARRLFVAAWKHYDHQCGSELQDGWKSIDHWSVLWFFGGIGERWLVTRRCCVYFVTVTRCMFFHRLVAWSTPLTCFAVLPMESFLLALCQSLHTKV